MLHASILKTGHIMTSYRTESDALGEVKVPDDALWGSATQRAIENFNVSRRRFPTNFISKLALIKQCAAEVNCELKLLEKNISDAIASAASNVAGGNHFDQFPLDIFQTGSGTSTNMNANEVIANLANLSLGGRLGAWEMVHPNDHVNMGQSSNDVMPSALHIAAASKIKKRLIPLLEGLHESLSKKSGEFDQVFKIGRTHLMDALPITLGQEFGGWARQVEKSVEYLKRTLPALSELALGGTAVGTGTGAHPDFAKRVCKKLSKHLKIDFVPAKNHFEAISSHGPCVEVSGSLKTIAVSLSRIADDIRLLSSGPRLGLGEIRLPALQPGSSIMPGKINPVIPEMVCQVATQVVANDVAITTASMAGHLELNTQLPVIISNLLESIDILANATDLFAKKCIDGIEACEEKCRQNIDRSLALATALVPKIGYARASEIAKMAYVSGKTVREVALSEGIAGEEELSELLNIENLICDK